MKPNESQHGFKIAMTGEGWPDWCDSGRRITVRMGDGTEKTGELDIVDFFFDGEGEVPIFTVEVDGGGSIPFGEVEDWKFESK